LQAAKLAGQATAHWYPAPLKCIEAIEASAQLSFAEGLALERTLFLSLLESDTSKALRYQFLPSAQSARSAIFPPQRQRRWCRRP